MGGEGGEGVLSGLQLVMPSGALRKAPAPTSESCVGTVRSSVGIKNGFVVENSARFSLYSADQVPLVLL